MTTSAAGGNWAGNIHFDAPRFAEPTSVDELSALVKGASSVRAVGTRHSFTRIARGDDGFDGSVVSLGMLGIVTRVELQIEPAYAMTQVVDRGLDWEAALADLDAVLGSATSVSLFTNWRDARRIDQVWRKSRVPFADAGTALHPPPPLPGTVRATTAQHPLQGESGESCTDQSGAAGPWFERLPHFRAEFTPSHGDELQSEFFVPRARAVEALESMRRIGPTIADLLFVSEIRSVRADELWLSGAYGGDVVGIHFTWKPMEPEVRAALPAIEEALSEYGARPHWGKVFTSGPESLASVYPRWKDFAELRARWDPRGVFCNALVRSWGF